jgi:hypothetical protein
MLSTTCSSGDTTNRLVLSWSASKAIVSIRTSCHDACCESLRIVRHIGYLTLSANHTAGAEPDGGADATWHVVPYRDRHRTEIRGLRSNHLWTDTEQGASHAVEWRRLPWSGVDEISGAQRAVLGASATTVGQVRDWVVRHLRDHLGSTLDVVLFTGGDIGAVFGLRLADGREVVLKALRPGADERRLRGIVRAQNALSSSGFGCARVLDGPSRTGGVVAIVEERLTCVPSGSPHDPAARAAMAAALAAQIDALRTMDGADLVPGRPAWAD